jgi:hypothetical protein
MPKSPLWAGPAKRRAMRWGECGKALETDKRGLPAFVVFPAFPQSGEKHRFALIFLHFLIKQKVQESNM